MNYNLYNIVFIYRFNFEYETKQTFVDFLNEQNFVWVAAVYCLYIELWYKTCQMHLLIFLKEKFQVL